MPPSRARIRGRRRLSGYRGARRGSRHAAANLANRQPVQFDACRREPLTKILTLHGQARRANRTRLHARDQP